MSKKIVLLIASEGYQSVEYSDTADQIKKAGITLITASDYPGTAQASDGSHTQVDMTLSEIDPHKIDGLFLIGGPGALDHLNSAPVHALLKKIQDLRKPYGAICVSPRILAQAGVLTSKKATGWDEDKELGAIFKHHGVLYEPQPVVVDGLVVTAEGPHAAEKFGAAIAQLITSR